MQPTSGSNNQLANVYAGKELQPMKPIDLAKVQVGLAFQGAVWVETALGRFAELTEEQINDLGYGKELAKVKEVASQIDSIASPRNDIVQYGATYASVPFAAWGFGKGMVMGTVAAETMFGTSAIATVAASGIPFVAGLLVSGTAAYVIYKLTTTLGNGAFATGDVVFNIANATAGKINDLYNYCFVPQNTDAASAKKIPQIEYGQVGEPEANESNEDNDYGLFGNSILD